MPGGYVFNYFCGCLYQDPIDIQVDTLDRLNQPPIIVYSHGVPFTNVTDTISTGTLSDGEPVSVYQYWYFWSGCQLTPGSPLCVAGHVNNDWEPVYVYWKTTNPFAPTLLAVWTRIHFQWRQTGGSAVELNGTQPIVKFALGSVTILGSTYTGIIPSVYSGGFVVGLLGANASVTIPTNTNSVGYFTQGTWSYNVVNGGPHSLQLYTDQNSPPGSGPTAYEPGAGPQDPFQLYGTGRNIQTAGAAAVVTTLVTYLILTFGLAEERALRKWIGRKH